MTLTARPLLLALLLSVVASIGVAQAVRQVDGIDWSLPDYVGLSPHGGVWRDDGEDKAPYIHASFLDIEWKAVNPAPGVFDFSPIEDVMTRENRNPLIIRINWFGECAAPDWVLQRTRVMSERTIVFWDQAYYDAFAPLITAFGARYAADPRLDGLYIGFGDGQKSGRRCSSDDDGWGEYWMTDAELAEAQSRFGLSPSVLESATKRLLDVTARAFRGHTGKLMFTNIARFASDSASPYNAMLGRLATHLAHRGIGIRNGEIENWSRYIDSVFGQKLAVAPRGTVRLYTDERFANGIGNRFWGDENEFYGRERYVLGSSGPYRNQGYRFYVSSLRGLQMRYNHMAIRPEAILRLPAYPWNPTGLMIYQAQVLGRDISNTPDAFTLLGERYLDADYLHGPLARHPGIVNGMLRIRGIERWLSEIGDSAPAYRINMPGREQKWEQYYLPDDIDYEYAARASAEFLFDLNDTLARRRCARGCDVEIKLSYKADAAAQIWVETAAGPSAALALSTDNRIHTATFTLHSRFSNGLQNGADFVVHSDGADLTLLLVRLVFLQ